MNLTLKCTDLASNEAVRTIQIRVIVAASPPSPVVGVMGVVLLLGVASTIYRTMNSPTRSCASKSTTMVTVPIHYIVKSRILQRWRAETSRDSELQEEVTSANQ